MLNSQREYVVGNTKHHANMLNILYEQGSVLVVAKPAGVSSQAPAGIDCMERRARAFLQARQTQPWAAYLAMPHRLDRPVSGALLMATRKPTARKLSRQFEHREVQKIYWGLIPAHDIPTEGEWRDFIKKVPDKAQAELADASDPEASQAVLRYRVLKQMDHLSLLQIELESGRYHQIRLQCASRGVPILGDEQYGSSETFGIPYGDPRARQIALHAREIGFTHPETKSLVRVVAPLPAYWGRFGIVDNEAPPAV